MSLITKFKKLPSGQLDLTKIASGSLAGRGSFVGVNAQGEAVLVEGGGGDFADKYNKQVQQSSDVTDLLTYSPFEIGIYGRPGSGTSNAIGITLNNVLDQFIVQICLKIYLKL